MFRTQLVLPHRITPEQFDIFKAYLPYCAEGLVDFESLDHLKIEYTCKREQDAPGIEDAARKLLDTLRETGVPALIDKKVIFDNRSTAIQTHHEIYTDLLKDGHLIKFGEGQYGMGKTFLQVFKYFERGCYQLALRQNPVEYVYPIMIPIHYLKQCGYFGENPQSATFLSTLDRSVPANFKEVQGGEFPFLKSQTEPEHVGKAAVCLHCYPHFENRVIAQPVTITTQGRCYRHESMDMKTNLWEFIMRESIYLGSAESVRERLEEIRHLTEAWLTRLGVQFWIESADDPFFASDPAVLKMTRLIRESKYELRIGDSKTSLAAASFNFHGPHFSKAFNITDGKKYVATGCAGFGIERLTYAFLTQYGLQTERWPRHVQEEINSR